MSGAQTSDEVAAVIKRCVDDKVPHFRYVSSDFATAFVQYVPFASAIELYSCDGICCC